MSGEANKPTYSLVTRHSSPVTAFLERETGIEPATNSLEGCDSTTELLPPTFRISKSQSRNSPAPPASVFHARSAFMPFEFSPTSRNFELHPSFDFPVSNFKWWTGEGSNLRRPHGPADLQSAAFDRTATCPNQAPQARSRGAAGRPPASQKGRVGTRTQMTSPRFKAEQPSSGVLTRGGPPAETTMPRTSQTGAGEGI